MSTLKITAAVGTVVSDPAFSQTADGTMIVERMVQINRVAEDGREFPHLVYLKTFGNLADKFSAMPNDMKIMFTGSIDMKSEAFNNVEGGKSAAALATANKVSLIDPTEVDYIHVCFVGNLGKDDPTTSTKTGKTYFSVAHNVKGLSGQKLTEWIKVFLEADKLAAHIAGERVRAGDTVTIFGSLSIGMDKNETTQTWAPGLKINGFSVFGHGKNTATAPGSERTFIRGAGVTATEQPAAPTDAAGQLQAAKAGMPF